MTNEKTPAPETHVPGLTNAERIDDLRLAAKAIRTYMPETLPADEDGKIHFARALAEAAAEAIENALVTTEGNPVAWRYRHDATVSWSYASTPHPRQDLEQEALYVHPAPPQTRAMGSDEV